MKKIKILALFGPSGAGKDFLTDYLLQALGTKKLHKMISCTTRAKRENEINGKDYYFLSRNKFAERLLSGDIIEATEYSGEIYGSTMAAIRKNKLNIAVLDPIGIECLSKNDEFELYPVYIYAQDRIRLTRVLTRETYPDCEKICRRFLEDKKKFNETYDFEFLSYNNSYANPAHFISWLRDQGILSKNG